MKPIVPALFVLGVVVVAALAADPAVVPWERAGDHAGDVITIEGDVAAVQASEATCVLEFTPDDARAFRVVLVVPLFSSMPPDPERFYRGARVRVTGRVTRFQGRPEMVLQRADQIEVVSPPPAVAAAPAPVPSVTTRAPGTTTPSTSLPPTTIPTPSPPPTTPPAAAPPPTTTPAASPPPTTAPAASPPPPPLPPAAPRAVAEPPPAAAPPAVEAPEPARAVPPAATPAPRPVAPGPAPESARGDACERARARRRAAATAAGTDAERLARCLADAGSCQAERAAVPASLSALEAAEREVGAVCP